MKKILIFGAILGLLVNVRATAGVRDGTSAQTQNRPAPASQSRTATTVLRTNTNNNETTRNVAPTRTPGVRNTRATTIPVTTTRTARVQTRSGTRTTPTAVRPVKTNATTPRTATQTVSARATTTDTTTATSMSETRTGAAYNQCKTAYFQCMDQFCALKNDEYRRCSCSSRIDEMIDIRKNINDTNAKLSEFTENLDVVGMTAAQATAMHTASDGENALTRDVSASKALLTAIMNSIRGEDATVAGKMSDLNSINLSFDTTNVFGLNDTGQLVATYNGIELYNAVYPSCRNAVQDDCNDASLQRAVTAYLMAIEQDCNTVQTALTNTQREIKAAIREGDAMLDLARIENRKKHNSSDMATCINAVESAVLSEQVCGAKYHKCLDNGEFIDVTTGAPIAGVVNFNELGKLLKFDFGKDSVDQKLSQIPGNQKFLQAFESKTKKFAADALDTCTEIADAVWSEYLDKALLDIYYAQQSKVTTIQNGCFDLISACYEDRETAITAAMSALIDGTSDTSLQPNKIVLTEQMCSDYIDSCNGMFGENIIRQYVENQTTTDRLAACRAVAQQCFDDFGGTNYENFYTPNSGLFVANTVDDDTNLDARTALDWFTLYSYDENGIREAGYKSVCAQQVADIPSCTDIIESVFGGLDVVIAQRNTHPTLGFYQYSKVTNGNPEIYRAYGWATRDAQGNINWDDNYEFKNRRLRPTGVATEVYNQIIDSLINQCTNVQGKFVEAQFVDHNFYQKSSDNICIINWENVPNGYNIGTYYGNLNIDQGDNEDMCPKNYSLNVDTDAWGFCSCWENGARRSKNGLSVKCVAALPVYARDNEEELEPANDTPCRRTDILGTYAHIEDWCTATINTNTNQVCPLNNHCPDYSNDCSICPDDSNTPTNCGGANQPTCDFTCQTTTCTTLDNIPKGVAN